MSTQEDREADAREDAYLDDQEKHAVIEHHDNCAALFGPYSCTCEACEGMDAEAAAEGLTVTR